MQCIHVASSNKDCRGSRTSTALTAFPGTSKSHKESKLNGNVRVVIATFSLLGVHEKPNVAHLFQDLEVRHRSFKFQPLVVDLKDPIIF